MKPFLLLLALLTSFVLSNNVLCAQPGSARHQLDTFAEGLESLQANFRQVVISSDGRVQDRSEGEVWLSRPDRFRWAYGGDFPELVVADGQTIWIYDEALEQVTVKDQGSAGISSPLALLTDPGQLDEKFEIREAGETETLQLLDLRARGMETEFERLLAGLKDNVLELLIMEDAFGLRTEISFSEIQRNPPIDPELFQFEPPAGSDVIGDLPVAPQER